MEPVILEEAFAEEQGNISIRNSGWNQGESSRETNHPHKDLSPVQKLASSIVPIDQNREAIFENVAIKLQEMQSHIRQSSNQIRKDLTIGVCSPGHEVSPSQISKQMDGHNAGDGISGEDTASHTEIHGSSQKKPVSQAQNVQLIAEPSNSNRETINNNNPTSLNDHKLKAQPELHESAGDSASGVRGVARNDTEITPQQLETKTTNKVNNKLQGDDSNDQQGHNTKNMAIQSTT